MKKWIALGIFCLVSCLAVWAECAPGHIRRVEIIVTPDGVGSSGYCCIPVGDGSELSCTDGTDWWNEPA